MSIAKDLKDEFFIWVEYCKSNYPILEVIQKYAQKTDASKIYQTVGLHYFITYKDRSWLFVSDIGSNILCSDNFQVEDDYVEIPFIAHDPICFNCSWAGPTFKPCDEHSKP